MAPSELPAILIEKDGRTLATAELHPTGTAGVVHTDMHVESGHLPMGTPTRLVDAVLAHPDVSRADRLVATMPLGDTEMLARVRECCADVQAHAAGATKVVEARVPRARRAP